MKITAQSTNNSKPENNHIESDLQQLQNKYRFFNLSEIRACEIGRTKGCVYACIVKQQFIYVGITENTLTQRILEHLRHPKTKFTRMINGLNEEDVLWTLLEHLPFFLENSRRLYREDLGEAEKRWIRELGAFNTSYGLNETAGGKGTAEIKRSEEWIKNTKKRKKEIYSDAKKREMQSRANAEAHRLNPNIAAEHSLKQKDRYNGSNATTERQKVSEGMKTYLTDPDNLAQHAWDRGARPFIAINAKGIQGFFLNKNECARKLGFSSSSHISKSLKNPGKTHKGNLFVEVGMGMTYEKILEVSLGYSSHNFEEKSTDYDRFLKEAWEQGERPFVVVQEGSILGAFLSRHVCAEQLKIDINSILNWEIREALSFEDSSFIPIGIGLTTQEILSSEQQSRKLVGFKISINL